MHLDNTVTFPEFADYLAYLDETTPGGAAALRLPTLESEFEDWWRLISVSEELRERWTTRIHHCERSLTKREEEPAASRKAA